jgi:hypothetical protein
MTNYFKPYPTAKTTYVVEIHCTTDDSVLDSYQFEDQKRAVKLFAHLIENDVYATLTESSVYTEGKFTFET